MISLGVGFARAADCWPPPAALLGWWAGEGNASDRLGLNLGTNQGNTTFVTGQVGQGFAFDGTNGYVQIPDAPLLSPHVGQQGEISLEVWVLLPRLPQFDVATGQANRAVVVKGTPGSWEYGFEILTNGAPFFAVWQANGSGYSVASTTNRLSLGAWHHLVGTLRKGAFCRLYVDGQLAAESTSFSGDTSDGGAPLYIGRRGDGQFFDGQVDEVSLYGRALNAGEVTGLFTAGTAGKCAAVPGAGVPYFTDFENGPGTEWSVPNPDSSEAVFFTRFLGRFGNSPTSLTLTNLVPGQAYTLGFDFYTLDSWDGGNTASGDLFSVNVNGSNVFRQSFTVFSGNSQSYPARPDEGPSSLGFHTSYPDAIYRNIELRFVAANALTVIQFLGQNLEDVNNESWGLDNVGVQLTAALTNTFVRSTSLPPAGTTNSLAVDSFLVWANWPLPASATNAANFSLREAGADGVLGTGDDTLYPVTGSLPGLGGHSLALALVNGPLQPGLCRFQTTASLVGTNGAPVPVFTRDFTIVHPVLGRVEGLHNDTQGGATALPLAESPVGTGFFTAYGLGVFGPTSEVDYWSFNAEAGDVISVRLEAEAQGVNNPQLYLQNSSGANVATYGGSSGVVAFQNLTIGTPGTYYLRVWASTGSNRPRYALRMDLTRNGPQLESEGNDAQASANQINLNFSPGVEQGRVAGAIPGVDTAGDFYRLGVFNPGNAITATLLYPTGATLSASQTILSVQLAGNPNPLAVVTNATLNFNVPTNGVYFVHVETTNRNLRAQYLLTVNMADTVPPQVADVSLPAELTATTAIVDRLTLGFSEDVLSTTLSNTANYELRGAGPNGLVGDADDVLYRVAPSAAYSGGLSAAFTILDGPLQPGFYRFTLGTDLQDRAFNHLAAPYVRSFTVASQPGYGLENRNNDTLGSATGLSPAPSTNGNGTVAWVGNVGTPAQPQGIAAAQFNADTNLDLVTANYNGDNITVFTNNGSGLFTAVTNIPTGNGAVMVATGDLNGDAQTDIAVANYAANTVSLLLGNGNAGFTWTTNLAGFSNPYNLVLADLNNDSKADLIVPNYGNGTVSVLLGNGDGTFQARTNYPGGSNPEGVVVGDLNNDGRPDLAVASYGSSTVSVFTNTGSGTFVLATNVPVGPNPRSVALADVTGDGKADLVTAQAGDNSISVLAGTGDGTFQPRKFFYGGFTNPHQLQLVDMNGDGSLDVVVPGYGNNTFSLFLNDGAGGYTNYYSYGTSGNPIGVAAGDFNGDGRPDLAFCHYYGNIVSLWVGNAANPLPEDPVGSGLRTALGRGTRANSGDIDFWQFSGTAGDQVIVAVDTVGNPASSQLYYQIQGCDGGVLTSWNSASTGWGQSGVVTLPKTGTYFVRVAASSDYQGEYRLRVTLARPPVQLSSEANTSLGAASTVRLVRTNNNHLVGSLAGYLSLGNGADYYSFGNLLGGTTVTVGFRQPASSGIAEMLSIYNAAGTLLTNSLPGVTNFVFTIPPGSNGVYYAAISAAQAAYAPGAATAIGFNGSSSYVDVGAWSAGTQWTLQAWANPASLPGGRHTIVGAAAQYLDWSLVLQDGQFAINLILPGGGNTQYRSGEAVTPGQWYQVTATCDGTNAWLYIDGQLRLVGAAGTYTGTAQGTRIGGDVCCGDYFPGLINDVRIWNRPLSAGEIAANLHTPLSGSEANLLGYWPLSEGHGGTTADLSTFQRTGTLNGGAAWVNLGPTNAAAPGLRAQYLLSFDLTSATPPAIVGVSLPASDATNADIITSFTVSFNEDMDPRFTWLARNLQRFNGRSYLLTDTATDWQSAEAAALALGGHLASLTSAAENTFLNQTFGPSGELWIGLNLFSAGGWAWSSGESVTYQNWSGSEPNNGGGSEFTAKMYTSGAWADVAYSTSLRGLIEITNAADADADGLVDSLDPYPSDPKNAFDLRAAGPDGTFDTADDIVYRVYSTGYASGLSTGFAIADGPLQAGDYRFQVTTALSDRFGQTLPAEFTRLFTIAPVAGFLGQNRRTNGVSTTSLSLSPSNRMDGSFASASSYATPSNPHYVTQGYLNGDTNLDLISANISADNITVWLGRADGTFQAATNIPTGDGPISVVVADFNGDTKADLAVAHYYGHTVTILLGEGNGNFQFRTNLTGFSNPCNLVATDCNHDTNLDLVVPNYGNSTVAVWLGNGDGTFQFKTNYSVGSNPETVVTGDLNGDAQPDLVVANASSAFVSVLLGNTNGTFQAAANYPNVGGNRYATLGDVNGDGRLDLVAISGGTLSVFFGNGDGTFQARTDYSIGGSDPYQVALADINSDGALDAVVAGYGSDRLYTVLNNGDGTFGGQGTYNPGGRPISVTVGDYNHDGRVDLAVAGYSGSTISVLLGNNTEGLAPDPAGTGLRIVAARGNLADGNDLDYWTFSGQVGDVLQVAVQNPGDPTGSRLRYRIYYPGGTEWTSFVGDYYGGRGQWGATLPIAGTYSVRVEQYDGYVGEYRLRVTLAPPSVQIEVENNDSIANANALAFAIAKGAQSATVLGYLGNYDTVGDFFQLGNLAADTLIKLGLARPASSGLLAGLAVYNAAGAIMTNSVVGDTNLAFIVPAGGDGTYYARIFDAYAAGRIAPLSLGGTNGTGLWLDGSSAWINFTNAVIPTAGDFTVEAWAYSSGPDGYHDILSQGSGGNAFYLGYRSWKARAGDGWEYIGSVTWPQNAWHHFAVVKSSTNTLLFIDGVQVAAKGSAIPNPAASTPLRFGRQYGGNGEYWNGDLDEVRIWNVARAATDIAANLTNRLAGTESGLVGYWRFDRGSGVVVNDATTNGNVGTFQGLPLWIPPALNSIQPAGILAQYLLDLRLSSANPPSITSLSLPAEGTTNYGVWDRFSLTFSQDMNAGTVASTNSYELRAAGPDDAFGTGDDQFYGVVNSPAYAAGTNASYLLAAAPLQPGRYRFTANTNLADKTLNPLATNFARNFAIANVPGFCFESRTNNSQASATSLSVARTNRADGSFFSGPGLSLGSNPERLTVGRLNADTHLDLVVCQWNYPGVSVLLGNGDGSFSVKTNYVTGSGAWSLALGQFHAGTNLDLAVGNYYANTITVLAGQGDGTFQVSSNYAVGAQPYHVVTGDFNHDGKTDLAVPCLNSGNVSVLLGNGDGTFQPAVNYASGSGPVYVAVGDANGDGKQDLAVANIYSDNVSLFLGNGNGTFAAPVTLACGHNPRTVVLRDLNGDNQLDLAVFNTGDNTVSVMSGHGDGAFEPRVHYGTGASDSYELLATDMTGDGWPDLVVGGYNNNSVSLLPNRGDGTFETPAVYAVPNHVVGLVAADLNNDSRMDLAMASDGGNAVYTLLGNDSQPVAADGLLRTTAGRGNLASGDADYWSFSGQAGEVLQVAAQTPGYPTGARLRYRIYYPGGTEWTSFVSDYYGGRGQWGAALPVAGTYYVSVEQYDGYIGEYRLRVTLARPPAQVETEANDTIAQANRLSYTNAAGHRLATVLGYIGSSDGSGDYFSLGTLSAGASITLGAWQPPSSGFANVLEVYNSAGTLVGTTPVGATNLAFVLPPGTSDSYSARILDAHEAALAATPTLDGTNGAALWFNGASAWINFTNAVIPAAGDFTVEAWAYANGSDGYRDILSQGSGGNAFYLGYRSWMARAGDGWEYIGSVTWPQNAWHHFAVVKSSTNTLLFIDGVQVAAKGSAIPNPAASTPLRLGRQYGGNGEYWAGGIGEVRVWNVARSATAIAANLTQRLTGAESGLVGYWRLTEGAGLLVNDATTNGTVGTFQGDPIWVTPAAGASVRVLPGLFAQYLLSLDGATASPPPSLRRPCLSTGRPTWASSTGSR
jgi:hypothetical protein